MEIDKKETDSILDSPLYTILPFRLKVRTFGLSN